MEEKSQTRNIGRKIANQKHWKKNLSLETVGEKSRTGNTGRKIYNYKYCKKNLQLTLEEKSTTRKIGRKIAT